MPMATKVTSPLVAIIFKSAIFTRAVTVFCKSRPLPSHCKPDLFTTWSVLFDTAISGRNVMSDKDLINVQET